MNTSRIRRWVAPFAAMAIVLAACSDSDEADQVTPTSSTLASTATTTDATTEESPSSEPDADSEDGIAEADADVVDAVPVRPVPTQVSTESSHWVGVVSMSASRVEITWSQVEGDDVVYQLFRFPTEPTLDKETVDLDVPYAEVEDGLLFVDDGVEAGGFYTYVLRVIADDEVLERRWTDVLAVDDTTPPTAVTDVRFDVTDEGVLIEWGASSDNVEFGSYGVFRTDGEGDARYIGGGGDIGQTSFLDDTVFAAGAPADGIARYEIVAFDFHNNRSTPVVIEVTLG